MAAKKVKVEKQARGRDLGALARRAVLAALLVALAAKYATLDVSKKRFIKHLLKQVPYMPARYFA